MYLGFPGETPRPTERRLFQTHSANAAGSCNHLPIRRLGFGAAECLRTSTAGEQPDNRTQAPAISSGIALAHRGRGHPCQVYPYFSSLPFRMAAGGTRHRDQWSEWMDGSEDRARHFGRRARPREVSALTDPRGAGQPSRTVAMMFSAAPSAPHFAGAQVPGSLTNDLYLRSSETFSAGTSLIHRRLSKTKLSLADCQPGRPPEKNKERFCEKL